MAVAHYAERNLRRQSVLKKVLEAELTPLVRNMLYLLKLPHHKNWGGPMSEKGIPDLYLTIPPTGRACWIELKGSAGKPTPEQIKFIDKHSAAGALAFFAWDVETVVFELAKAGYEPAKRIHFVMPKRKRFEEPKTAQLQFKKGRKRR